MTPRVLLAAAGDVNNIRTWSGTPYHLLQVAQSAGVIHEGLPIQPADWQQPARRTLWNLASLARGRSYGGYQFSAPCIEHYWRPFARQPKGTRVVNCFQLFPPSIVADTSIELCFYIDQTLRQLFVDYGLGAGISRWVVKDAIQREQEGYQRAFVIVAHSQWAAHSLINDYGVVRHKIKVIVPGANLDSTAYREWADAAAAPALHAAAAPLRLVFVGKDARRKGLDRLIRALRLARRSGADCSLRVIGCAPEQLAPDLRTVEGVEWLGFINKQHHPRAYIDAVADNDIGCLLSHAEAGGMCLREFHALGLAVIGPDVGGSPDHVIAEAAHLFKPDAGDEAIAALLVRLSNDRGEVRQMRAVSWSRRHEASWQAAVTQLAPLLK